MTVWASFRAVKDLAVRLTRMPAGMREVAWHTVPEPELTVRLDGSVEYETSDGEVRHAQAGTDCANVEAPFAQLSSAAGHLPLPSSAENLIPNRCRTSTESDSAPMKPFKEKWKQ